jgi:hypothetical protein
VWAQTGGAAKNGPAAAAAVPDRISYQGQLVENGSPANGNRNMVFRFYDSSNCSGSPLQSVTKNNVPVQGGFFHVKLDVDPAHFSGSERWLRVEVGGVAYGCEEILPVPYALYSATTAAHSHLGETWTGNAPLVITGTFGFAVPALTLINMYAGPAGWGVHSQVHSPTGIAIVGEALALSGETAGVSGRNHSTSGRGLYGWATADTGETYGVYARSNSSAGTGVYGWAAAGSGTTYGVYGVSSSTSGRAVYGRASALSGSTYGVWGSSASVSGVGVVGSALATTGMNYGGYFSTPSTGGTGVVGWASAAAGNTSGVYGLNNSASGAGVFGQTTAANSNASAVTGVAPDPAWAGYFNGRVHVTGNLSAGGTKPFLIDHPLDPENQYLYHFALESPEVRNVYDGVATLDSQGAATVQLPDYFAALNTGDYRYQLTPIGAPMPGLYIAQEIEGNSFAIAGGEPGKRVSWQVTAVRNDPYLRDHPVQAEVEKLEEERGTYLYPQGYGRPASDGFRYPLPIELEAHGGS